jgi:hypothetical protein
MLLRQIPKEKWNNFLKNKSHSVFQTYEWAKIMETEEWHPIWLINDDWSGGMVLMENHDHTQYESMRLGCYGGVIGEQVNLAELMSTEINYIRIFDYFETTKCEGWDKQYVSNYIIDLNNYKLSNGRRDDLRLAKKAGLKLVETADLEKFYSVFVEGMKKFPDTQYVKPIEFFKKMMDSGFVKLHLVLKGDKAVGCSAHIYYNGEIFGYTAQNLPEYSRMGVTTFNLQEVINQSPESKTYNFGVGINDGNKFFKTSWGAKEHQYPIYGIIFKPKYEYA